MANISASGLVNNINQRPSTPSQQLNNSSASSSIRLLTGSHISSTNSATMSATSLVTSNAPSITAMGLNGNVTPHSNASPQNPSFFQANPHLLNSTVLQSSYQLNSQSSSQFTTPLTNNIVFKEPHSVNYLQVGLEKKSNNRILYETSNSNTPGFQVIYSY